MSNLAEGGWKKFGISNIRFGGHCCKKNLVFNAVSFNRLFLQDSQFFWNIMFYGAIVGGSAACDQTINYDKSIKTKVTT